MSAKGTKRTDASGSAALPWKGLLLIAVSTAALTVGCFFLAAIFLLRQDTGSGVLLTLLAFLCCALPALLGGFLAGKQMKRSGWLYGMLCTVPQIVTLCVLCVSLYGRAGKLLPAAAAMILVCGAVGGILSVNLRRRKRYR